jgi:PAS domain S-box-containing protein
MIGHRPDEMEGKKIIDVMGEKGFKTIRPHIEAVLSGARVEYEAHVDFHGASPRLLHVIYTPDRDQQKNIRGWVASIIDITEQRQAQNRIAADLHATTLLREIGSECVRDDRTVAECLQKILEVAIIITEAQKGTLQVFDQITQCLHIAAQKEFGKPFTDFFQSVKKDHSTCGAALQSGARVIVSDVLTSEIFTGQPAQEVLLAEQVRAVTSTPLVSSEGHTLGMISTHFGEPHEPQARELHFIDLLARLAADYLERKRHEEHQRVLVAELDHRVKNILARVSVIARYSRRDSRTMDEFARTLDRRIESMSDAHRMLSQRRWQGVDLADLVRRQLAPYTTETNAVIGGADIVLPSGATQALAMVLHELVTNAVKYGSLSIPSGKVSVTWDRKQGATGFPLLAIAWRETRGPPAEVPSSSSYGTDLIRGLIPRELGGSVDLVFAPEGLGCDIEFLIRSVNPE